MASAASRLRVLSLFTALATLAAATPAAAKVTIGPTQIVVSPPDGSSVVVDRSPLRIAYRDSRGRLVLAESANSLPAPALEPPTDYPPTLGQSPQRDPGVALYTPLSFLVGSKTFNQYNSAFWVGDMQGGQESGVLYSARAVTAAALQGSGVRLTVSTSDPTGRTLSVLIAPQGAHAVEVSAVPVPDTGVALMADAFASGSDEAFHGFGGRHNALDQHGQDLYSWDEEENFSATGSDALAGEPNYMFPNGSTAAYHPQPLFISSRPYGFLLDQPEFARFRLDSDRPDSWQVSAAAAQLKYIVAPGDAAHAMATLTAITGRERMPPPWAMGATLDRLVRSFNAESAAQYEQHVRDDLAAIARLHVHLDGYRIEGWAELPDSTLRSFIAAFHRLGTHVLLYFPAFVASPTGGYQDDTSYDQAVSQGLVATNAAGAPYLFGSPFGAGSAALLDFSNPATVSWWQARLRRVLDEGVDGFMQDFGEQVLGDMRFHDGEGGLTMHNRYPILYDRATRALFTAYMRAHPHRQLFFYTRSGYTGRPGSLAYDNANFLGDNESDWTRINGIGSIITDMLNRSLGGAYGSTTDIGGYSDSTGPAPTKELFIRWSELAALTPFFRVHNGSSDGTHTPWSYDAQTLRIYRSMLALHLRTRPLMRRLWAQADRTGMPPLRPLWLAAPGDPGAAAQDQEFLLGPDVLVAPVVEQGATSRAVYLPAGCWQASFARRRYRGPLTATVPAALGILPYFTRCGRDPFRS